MPIDRRQFVAATLAAGAWTKAQGSPHPGQRAYGSGSFGEWIEDQFGLPAFRYTCNQTTDPKAVTKVGAGILSATEHVHQVGNDRLVAIVSNYGHVQVRQDEGAPKYLNAWSPERSQFGGGIGYLTDGAATLHTYYTGDAAGFERIFGAGYFRKKVSSARYAVDQVIVAPFGDDPVLLSQVTIANRSPVRANLRWIEVLGLSALSILVSFRTSNNSAAAICWICAASLPIALPIASAHSTATPGCSKRSILQAAQPMKKRSSPV